MGPKRRSDWTSNNRVLNGGNKKYNGRNPNFDTEETRLLISLWGDPKVQKTLITTHKKHPVIARLADQLKQYGYHRTAEEINTRIKNLKCFYNRIKKDMEVGIITEPTWKHFYAMERIMTRPIFSVRPDEIPKPSPRFRMEGLSTGLDVNYHGKENRERKRTHRVDDVGNDSFEGNQDDDDDELFTQEMFEAELDCEMDDFSLGEEHAMQEEVTKTNDTARIPNENCDVKKEQSGEDSDIKAESGLIIPKQEPIDVDDEDPPEQQKNGNRDADDANEIFPKLSAYLQLASNNSSTASSTKANNKVITTIAGSNATNTSEINTSASNPIKLGQQMVIAQQQSQQGKISLVPTNILLKPPQPQLQLRPQAQHIIYNPGLAGNSAIATSGATGQMPNGMKVLLVNTLPKNSVGTVNTDAQQKIITSNAMKANCITSTVPTIGEVRCKPTETRSQRPATSSGAGFRSLISQLITIQSHNLEVSRQRLEVERQRLDFEKSIAERIIAALPQIFMPSVVPQNDERATPTMPLLTPKIEKED